MGLLIFGFIGKNQKVIGNSFARAMPALRAQVLNRLHIDSEKPASAQHSFDLHSFAELQFAICSSQFADRNSQFARMSHIHLGIYISVFHLAECNDATRCCFITLFRSRWPFGPGPK